MILFFDQEKDTLQTGYLYKKLHVRGITAPELQESFLHCHNRMGSGIFYVTETHLVQGSPAVLEVTA